MLVLILNQNNNNSQIVFVGCLSSEARLTVMDSDSLGEVMTRGAFTKKALDHNYLFNLSTLFQMWCR